MEEKKVVVKKATREGYAAALEELAERPDIVVMDADLGAATKSLTYKKVAPERFFDAGIAEEHAVTFAKPCSCPLLRCLPPAERLNKSETASVIRS